MKKKLKKIILFFFLFLILAFIVLIFTKQAIFDFTLNKKLNEFNNHHNGFISIQKSTLNGFTNFEFKNICLSPNNKDTLLTIDSLTADLKLTNLIFGQIKINSLFISDFNCKINVYDTTDNFSFIFKKNADTLTKSYHSVNYYKRTNYIFNSIFKHIPQNIIIKNLNIKYLHKKNELNIFTDCVNYQNNNLSCVLKCNDSKISTVFKIVGIIISENETVGIKIVNANKKNRLIAGFEKSYNAKLAFDTAFIGFLKSNSYTNVYLVGKTKLSGLSVNQPSVSSTDVNFSNLQLNFNVNIGENYFEVDSSTTVRINKLTFNPYIKFTSTPTKKLTLKINKELFDANNLFESIPEGLFHTLYGLKTKGQLSYNLYLDVDFSTPDSLKFNSELSKKNFSIASYGKADYSMLNKEFSYTAFENNQAVTTFNVGSSNPEFTPLSEISPFLKNAVLCTEDGGFYYHRGFLIESIRESIIEDIKRKKFARGGSTITMQLVKNVFLNKNKTIARKLEEMIIVWLIENQQLCTKDRMYEVYLNIIEWGPKIYGITAASKFYFNKKPKDLSLSEAIFLAKIIPKPKYFKSEFNNNGELNDFAKQFIITISNKMLNKQMVNGNDVQNLNTNITLTDEAKAHFIPIDSLETMQQLDFNF